MTNRIFNAPEGYRRLTINLKDDIHEKLKKDAVELDCTATSIIENLLTNRLNYEEVWQRLKKALDDQIEENKQLDDENTDLACKLLESVGVIKYLEKKLGNNSV